MHQNDLSLMSPVLVCCMLCRSSSSQACGLTASEGGCIYLKLWQDDGVECKGNGADSAHGIKDASRLAFMDAKVSGRGVPACKQALHT